MAGPTFPGATAPVENEAVAAGRRRAAGLRSTLGPAHPEYASALNQLALMLLMQGDAAGAEPLLREAVEVRRVALGERHPDFATALSSLGGLVWARGDFDAAEPLLREAAESRRAALGPDHPKTRMVEDNLKQLVATRSEWEADCLRQMRQSSLAPNAPEAVPPERERELAGVPEATPPRELAIQFQALANDLDHAARNLISRGEAPTEALLNAARGAAVAFRIRAEALRQEAHSLGASAGAVDDLEQLERLWSVCRAAEAAARNTRERALAVLKGVEGLTCPGRPQSAPLEACRRQAAALAGALAGSEKLGPKLESLAAELAAGGHPLAAVLGLARLSGDADDGEWAALYEAVHAGCGPALAAMLARGRVLASVSS